MAFPRGFEPPTYRLGGGRSIELIYGNECLIILQQGIRFVNEKMAEMSKAHIRRILI